MYVHIHTYKSYTCTSWHTQKTYASHTYIHTLRYIRPYIQTYRPSKDFACADTCCTPHTLLLADTCCTPHTLLLAGAASYTCTRTHTHIHTHIHLVTHTRTHKQIALVNTHTQMYTRTNSRCVRRHEHLGVAENPGPRAGRLYSILACSRHRTL